MLSLSRKYKSLWLALLCAIGDCFSSTTSLPASFQSSTVPRFDEFAEHLVGPWYNVMIDKDDHEVYQVEEVMRSCGGAVQGVREISLRDNNKNKQEGQYLNRADDGFLPYYDGSYTWGPTKLSEDNEKQHQNRLMTRISLGDKNVGVRVLLTIADARILQRQRKGDGSLISSVEAFPGDHIKYAITWTHHVRCRMPSTSMPWMAQRL
eukprot:scaffold898_cov168-Amphora_coffeaeformis.AAC.10